METRVVAFDLDDTLVDHGRAARTAISAWLAGRGLAGPDSRTTIADAWMELERRHFGDYVAGITGCSSTTSCPRSPG
jgi:FMN phosphatase YigB (HAD superfamily)